MTLSPPWIRGSALALLLTSCTANHYAEATDAEVEDVLTRATKQVEERRRDELVLPDQGAGPQRPEVVDRNLIEGDPSVLQALPRDESGAAIVDLAGVLRLATHYNRDYVQRFEQLYRQGLGYTLTRFQFGPQLSWAFSTVWSDTEFGPAAHSESTRLALGQILPTGGQLTFGSTLAASRDSTPGSRLFGSTAGVSLTQPLLRGAGYEVSHEAWTQAERSLIYAVRDFELFRQQFSIDIARRYFDLLSQRKTLANEEANYEQAVFDRAKAEGMFSMDRQTEQEVFRARRRELLAENSLVDARADFDRALEQFRITLGLPVDARLELADQEPEFEPIRLDSDDAFEVARINRLDLMTERQQIEDSERAVRISENSLLPDLNLVANYAFDGSSTRLGQAGPEDWAGSVGVTLEVPIQRLPERNALQSAMISLRQAQRSYRERLDQLEVDVADRVRRLRSVERQIELQRELIEQERRAVTVSEIRYEAGELDNRDLLEARQALIDAQNALIRLQVDHFIGRLELLRELGILFVDEEGMW